MATVQDLYRELKFYIGEDVDIFYLINTAIRLVAKRLYWLESALVTEIMEVPIFAEVALTASDIAFVDSDPDTITGVAAAFLTTGFAAGMPIRTDEASNLGPFHVDTVVAGTITLVDDDSLVAASAGSAVTITSDDSFGYLPSDYWGLQSAPYLDGKTYPLLPLPDQDTEIQYSSASNPVYYKIRGKKIYVIPKTSSDFTIKADYFQKPDTMESLIDTIPYDDQFNDAIWELVKRIFKSGSIIDSEYEAFCMRAIDPFVTKRDRKAPRRTGAGINYDHFV